MFKKETIKYSEFEFDSQAGQFGNRSKTHAGFIQGSSVINVTRSNNVSVSCAKSSLNIAHMKTLLEY